MLAPELAELFAEFGFGGQTFVFLSRVGPKGRKGDRPPAATRLKAV
jgi:hypothetical protein